MPLSRLVPVQGKLSVLLSVPALRALCIMKEAPGGKKLFEIFIKITLNFSASLSADQAYL